MPRIGSVNQRTALLLLSLPLSLALLLLEPAPASMTSAAAATRALPMCSSSRQGAGPAA